MTNIEGIGISFGAFKAVGCLLMLFTAIPAFAQTSPPSAALAKTWCFASGEFTPDQRLGGCTAVIASKNATKKQIADAYLNRGADHLARNDVDGAIADFSE